MERALLEGEHNTEMEELQQEQERINVLKVQQAELIENSAKEREKVILILQCYILRYKIHGFLNSWFQTLQANNQ
jgi:hypothetical protein